MPEHTHNADAGVRLDKWLWCARFYKTRRLATEAINNGKVRMDGKRLKPSRAVAPGDVISVRRGPYRHTFTVLALTGARQSAQAAAALYEELPDSIAARAEVAQQIRAGDAAAPRTRGRPTKQDRRALLRFRRTGGGD